MLNALVAIALLAAFSWWDFLLMFSFAFKSREGALEDCLRYEQKCLGAIRTTLACWRNFRPDRRNLVQGDIPDRVLIVSNHQSLLDIPMLMVLKPCKSMPRFIAKRELGWGIPLISTLLHRLGHCLVKRTGDPVHAMREVMKFAIRCENDGTSPTVFPEGTRSRDGSLGTFHSAGVRKILETGTLPILVVALDGGWRTASLRDFFARFGMDPYRMWFLGVIPAPVGKKETLAALDQARAMIADAIAQMRAIG